MKASNSSDAQKAFILRQGANGVPDAENCRKAGVSQATCFNWKNCYDGRLRPSRADQPNMSAVMPSYQPRLSS